MSILYVCDKCGQPINPGYDGSRELKYGGSRLDLCYTCVKDFNVWMEIEDNHNG